MCFYAFSSIVLQAYFMVYHMYLSSTCTASKTSLISNFFVFSMLNCFSSSTAARTSLLYE